MGLVHPRRSQNKLAGYKFIEWLVGGPGAKLWGLNGGIPSNTKALSDPEVVAQVPQFELLAEAMPYRHITPLLTTPTSCQGMQDARGRGVAGAKTPQQAMDDAAVADRECPRRGWLQVGRLVRSDPDPLSSVRTLPRNHVPGKNPQNARAPRSEGSHMGVLVARIRRHRPVVGIPILYSLYLSFHEWRADDLPERRALHRSWTTTPRPWPIPASGTRCR